MIYILIPDSLTRKGFDICSIVIKKFNKYKILAGYKIPYFNSELFARILYRNTAVLLRDSYCYFESDLRNISNTYNESKIVFIPTEEVYVELFLKFVKKNGDLNFIYQLPRLDIYDEVRDKKRLNLLCLKNSISAPLCYNIDNIQHLSQEKYPLLLKPCVGSGSRGLIRLYKKEDLTLDIIRELGTETYHIQELIDNGKDVKGAFFLYSNGHFVNAYTHERIRTSPKEGGVTVLSKYSHNQKLIDEGKALLDKIKWNGLIMLEFLYDIKSKRYKIIEANPRLWGSIMLSEYSNTCLLSNYINLCVGKNAVLKEEPNKVIFIRWFFPVDFLGYIRERGRIKDFWKFNDTCFINWTYANKFSSILFNACALFNPHNLMRFFRK